MMRRKVRWVGALWVVALLLVLLTGCGAGDETEDPELANPASVYCNDLGYEEETRESDAGTYGVCLLPDGLACDSWDFLAGRCGVEHSYCAQQGGTLEADPDSNVGTCVFEDGSTCDEFDFFQGLCAPGE